MSIKVDENRKNRVHVDTVRGHKDKFFVVLSDGSEMTWEMWVASKAKI
jgi:hypothetical protein